MAKHTAAALARQVIEALTARRLTAATAESCTGGLVAGALTDVPGASDAFYGGFVTYSNLAKHKMIGVQPRLIQDYGAVSAQVARAMADGARSTARTDLALSITGIAGPSGGSDKKPVGLVYFACATSGGTTVIERRFGALSRDEIRAKSVATALELLLETASAEDQAP